jgi:large subunit ribosomal protein L13
MPSTQKTYSPKASEITRAWRLVDAEGQTLGRLASQVAGYLRGKHLPTFAEHMDVGDFVVVVNASRIRLTGNKARDRLYYRHSTYPGGLKSVALGDLLARHPERVIKHTVRGMLPHNALGRKLLRKLKVYAGPDHPHAAQFRAAEKRQSVAPTPHEAPVA